MDGSWPQTGSYAQSNGYPAQSSTAGGKMRVPTVHEALPYTPLSSIVPFNPDMIPPISALPRPPPTAFSNTEDSKTAKRVLEQLSAGATNAESASKRCQQSLRDVQRLLDAESLTQHRFKPRKFRHPSNGSIQKSQKHSSPLSPFAKMVFDSTNVSYGILTPESESMEKLKQGKKAQIRINEPKTTTNGFVTPHHNQPTPSSQQRTIHAVMPTSLTPSQRAEYQYMSDRRLSSDQIVSPSKRRDNVVVNGTRTSMDQRQKGDVNVQALQNMLLEIFEAEDQLQPDTSGAVAVHATTIFAFQDTADGSVPVLLPEALAKLESCIHKVTSSGRLQDIEVDHLIRVQKICQYPLAAVENSSLRVGEDWGEQDVEEWLMKLGTAENGLLAARTLMRIMSGAAQQKELQSEELLRETLEALKNVIEGCVVPIVEEPALSGEKIRGDKNAPPPNPKFAIASSHRKHVVSLLNAASRGFRLLGDLLVKTDFDGSAISSVEYLCKTLIFAENASTEKDSAIGVQNFEAIRRVAMDVLAKIFTKYEEQRQFIFDEILISLEKLPATKQSARQYRLSDAKPIQLVSALLMRLVQTSATRSNEALKLRSKARETEEESDDDADHESEDEESDDDGSTVKVSPAKTKGNGLNLGSIMEPLHKAAHSHAAYIINVLIQRAATTSKSSDEPYRRLLDIFTEDFLNVLGSSDWPAAELLLETMAKQMIRIINSEKSSVPTRTLALEMLGNMGSGILELQITARDTAQGIDTTESKVARRLRDMVGQLEIGNVPAHEMTVFDGPYRYVIQYLELRNTSEDPQLQTARGFHLMAWAYSVAGAREGSVDSDVSDQPLSSMDIQSTLKRMFDDPKWLEDRSNPSEISTAAGRLAAMVLTLNSPFCKAFNTMLSLLLTSMSSEHSTVKSRSLKSVVTLLEKDATVLDRNPAVLKHIYRCAADPSPLVRDSALGLIDKCLSLRPELNAEVYSKVIERTRDAAIGVRKRAMKMLKDIYLRNQTNAARSAIANAIIARINDTEESVTEIARTTMEEIWFQPFYNSSDRGVDAKLAYSAQAALLIATVEQSDDVLKVLEALLRRLLTRSKAAQANAEVCRTFIAILFDGVIDNTEIKGAPSQDSILRSLTIFARAAPTLFTTTQLERLKPYTENLTTSDDLDVYRSVIIILRNVIPYQPTMKEKTETLGSMQLSLLKSVPRLQKPELREVAPCLWTICGVLGDRERLPKFVRSVLARFPPFRGLDLSVDDNKAGTVIRLMRIGGEFGNACNFNDHLALFKEECTWSRADSVPGLIVETFCPFTSPRHPLSVRMAALEAICTVSQAWPKEFLRADVTNAFEMVFKDRIPSLEGILVSGLEGFFIAQEVPDEADDGMELGSGIASGTERLGKTYVASDQDGASTALAQRFLSDILRLALASCDEPAFIAARVVVSINKQGLVHPKESGPALVALETCPNKAVAGEAFKEHRSQHQKHESLFEKEYMRAVQQTFEYQQRVVGSPSGFSGQPPTSKMHMAWEVLKAGKAQARKKFLGNICQKLDFDSNKFQPTTASAMPQHTIFVRFCLENLAFFEYDKVDDLLHLLSSLRKVFSGTGSSVAQSIESEVLKIQVDGLVGSQDMVNGMSDTIAVEPIQTDLDPKRLHQLALCSQVLYMIEETRTFLRRLWNMDKHMSSKQSAKDVNKVPNRATNAPFITEAYLRRLNGVFATLDTEQAQRDMCKAFVELISVDTEAKVGSEEDADGELVDGYGTPSEGTSKSPSLPPSGSGRGRKRRPSGVNATPRKRGRPSMGKKRTSSAKFTEDDDDDGGWD